MSERDSDCVFCRVVGGEIPASLVYRDGTVTAFLDIRPVTPGHLLVIPDRHHAALADVPGEAWAQVTGVARRLAAALRASELRPAGVNLYVADGEVAGQEVQHIHVHVIPRSVGDGFKIQSEALRKGPPSRDELDRHAEAIRAAFGEGR